MWGKVTRRVCSEWAQWGMERGWAVGNQIQSHQTFDSVIRSRKIVKVM